MAVDSTKNKQVVIWFPNELLDEIKKYQHKYEIDSRSEAIRQLIKASLDENKKN